jgi:drug/metabolite transporter (DMT)-like permease
MSPAPQSIPFRIIILTVIGMFAFAANSILGRLALGRELIDPASFTGIRLGSGALMLLLILTVRQRGLPKPAFDALGASMLFLYAIFFSYAYVDLKTGTGALILFGTVQLTMILAGLVVGERPKPFAWLGMIMAIGGLVYLLLPGVSAPPLKPALLMAVAGMAWAVYSLHGKGSQHATADTAWNFVGTLPMMLAVLLFMHNHLALQTTGVLLAVASGALASGMGYALWYTVLPHLTQTQAGNVQLSGPIIAAFGGVVFMGEAITLRLVIATCLSLGGIALVIGTRKTAR